MTPDTQSSASRQHYIDTGEYLPTAEIADIAEVLPLWPEKRQWSDECGRRHGERTPSRMKPACPACDTIHCASDVIAVGRFDPTRPTGYMPRVGGCGCVYRTREEAEAVACAERVARREAVRR